MSLNKSPLDVTYSLCRPATFSKVKLEALWLSMWPLTDGTFILFPNQQSPSTEGSVCVSICQYTEYKKQNNTHSQFLYLYHPISAYSPIV